MQALIKPESVYDDAQQWDHDFPRIYNKSICEYLCETNTA